MGAQSHLEGIVDPQLPPTVAIWRLAPQDYHNFHCPVSGEIVSVYDIHGPLFSVSADAITAGNGAIFNERKVMIIDTNVEGGSHVGKVAYIAVGAVGVGSVHFTRAPGDSAKTHESTRLDPTQWVPLKKGDRLSRGEYCGYFAFGGSTVVGVFPQGSLDVEPKLLQASNAGVETLVEAR